MMVIKPNLDDDTRPANGLRIVTPNGVGGGVAHGPKGEKSYRKKKLNKSEKKLSIISLITEKNKFKKLFIFNDFVKQIKKTKQMNVILNKFKIKNSLIILDKLSKENIFKAIRNIPNVKVTDVNNFSSYDILKYENIIFTTTSIKELEKKY